MRNLMRSHLPIALRKGELLKAFFDTCIFGIMFNQNNLYAYVFLVGERLTHGSQTCIMRYMLNEKYDAEQRRISVATNEAGQIVISMPRLMYDNYTLRLQIADTINKHKLAGKKVILMDNG
jgi:hypothetical protein